MNKYAYRRSFTCTVKDKVDPVSMSCALKGSIFALTPKLVVVYG